MKPLFRLMTLLLMLSFIGCVSGNCRRANKEPVPSATSGAAVPESQKGKTDEAKDSGEQAERVWVYKYDGSKQCNMGDPVSVEKMAQELKGVKIYKSEKRNDGLMHIQACGTPTGDTNRYLIAKKDLDEAKKRGFEVWTFE